MDSLSWRPMVPHDLGAVVALAEDLFPDHYEAPERFAERLRASPAFCRVLAPEAGAIRGYLVAYPWPLGRIPPLNKALESIAGHDAIYVHDLGVHPQAAGQGHARAAVADLVARSDGAAIALVAVNGSAPFWRAQGFREAPCPALADTLASYGADARYMIRRP